MAVVPRVLLDHVAQDPPQAGRPAIGPGTPGRLGHVAGSQRLRDHRAGAGHGVLPERMKLLGSIPGGGAPVPVAVGVPVHRVPRGTRGLARATAQIGAGGVREEREFSRVQVPRR